MKCERNENTAGRWRKMIVEFGGGIHPRKVLSLAMGRDEPEMKRAIAVITAVMVKEVTKGRWEDRLEEDEELDTKHL